MQRNVLLVDAYPSSREGLRNSLRSHGCRVEAVSDGLQAIRKMKESQFQVAIIDLDLPLVYGLAMTGWDLARIFRALNPSVPVILVGAEGGRDIRGQLEEVQAAKFLEKPISPTHLMTILQRLDP